MDIVIDIGNSSIACGLYDNNKLIKKFRMPSDKNLTAYDYYNLIPDEVNDKLEGGIVGSVVDGLSAKITEAFKKKCNVELIELSDMSKMPVKLITKNLNSVGADRIANVVRAYNLYGGKPVIVVDYGTATTFDIITKDGEFTGGLIAPGILTQIKSLNLLTDKLPEIEIEDIKSAIGRNTKDCILAGIILGTACMTEGMLQKCEDELGSEAVVVLTGGLSGIVSKYITRTIDLVDENFTLDGLRDLYNINK